MRTRLVALLLGLLALGVPALAKAAGPDEFIKAKQAELTRALKSEKGQGQDEKVAAILDGMLDYDKLAQSSLKDHWSERTDQEKKAFTAILKRLVQRAYRSNLDKTLDYGITFGETSDVEGGTMVRTVATSKKNNRDEPLHVDYVLYEVAGKWLIIDIVTEGASLVKNYQRQFNRVIKKSGFAELVRRMEGRLEG